jgi:hypothetical protein
MVKAIYSNYDELDFGHLSWMYWHAVSAPLHVTAGQFGALIEALQRAYLKKHKATAKLLEDADWDRLEADLTSTIKSFDMPPVAKEILLNKARNLNDAPQNVVAERLFGILNLNLGSNEKQAWSQRNSASHGLRIKNDDYIKLIRDIKLLKVRFHRMLLCLTKASDVYYDYYTVNHPIRNLGDPVP